jgi:hypothetical protein
MTVKMEIEEEKKAKAFVITKLKEAKGSQSTFELSDLARKANAGFSTQAIRRAIWYLVDEGLVKFTRDMRIEAKERP